MVPRDEWARLSVSREKDEDVPDVRAGTGEVMAWITTERKHRQRACLHRLERLDSEKEQAFRWRCIKCGAHLYRKNGVEVVKCFACDRHTSNPQKATTSDGQVVYVGADCYRKIGPDGWQPPMGGPRLYREVTK